MKTNQKPAHLHSLLSWLIWSVTKLCSREETSAELAAPSRGSLGEANSMTQWAKAKVKCRSVRVSVWACCGKKQGNSTDCEPCNSPTQQFHTLWQASIPPSVYQQGAPAGERTDCCLESYPWCHCHYFSDWEDCSTARMSLQQVQPLGQTFCSSSYIQIFKNCINSCA